MEKIIRPVKKERLFTIALLFSSALVTLLLSEVVLRVVYPTGYFFRPPRLKTIFKPYDNIMPGVSGASRFETNSQGIRGDELDPSHTYRILAIGGSTTECLYLDQLETWPALLQAALTKNFSGGKVWVGNAGLSGLTTRHHIVAMRYFPFEQLKINTVMFLLGINDLTKRLAQDSLYDASPLTKLQTSILLKETFKGASYSDEDDPFFKKTALWQLLWDVKRIVVRGQGFGDVQQDAAGKVYEGWRNRRKGASEFRNELLDLSSGVEEYTRNIRLLIASAREKSLRSIFITQPTLWKADLSRDQEALLWFGGIGDFQRETGKPYYTAEALRRGMEIYNEALLNTCREKGVECIDLARILEKDTTVFYDDAHFNESGARKVSAVLADHFLEKDPFAHLARSQ